MAGGWLCLAAVVGLVVGRVIRNRDRQVPTDTDDRSTRPPGNAEPTPPPASPQRSRREP